MAGFRVDEIMVGTHRFTGQEQELPLHFSLTWGHDSLREYCNPFSPEFLRAEARGVITVGGLAHKADCAGTLSLLYFTERKVRYELEFTGGQGRTYRYVGEKVNIRPWNLHKSHVTCYGTITESGTGKEISRSIVYFPLRELPAFIRSVRLVSPEGRKASSFRKAPSAADRVACKVLGREEARVIAAMAGGIIPPGGSFEPGAAGLAEKWLPRTDYLLSRMPVLTRLELRGTLRVLNRILPVLFLKRLSPLTALDEQELSRLFRIADKSAFLGQVSIMLVKILVFPAFYGLPEVKDAIGYRERFANSPEFEGIKE
jgi:hypothetical protein